MFWDLEGALRQHKNGMHKINKFVCSISALNHVFVCNCIWYLKAYFLVVSVQSKVGSIEKTMGAVWCHRPLIQYAITLAGHNRGRTWSTPKISGQNVQLNDGAGRYAGSIIFHWAVSLICCADVVAERMLAKLRKVRILGHLVLWQVCERTEWVIEM